MILFLLYVIIIITFVIRIIGFLPIWLVIAQYGGEIDKSEDIKLQTLTFYESAKLIEEYF